MTNMNNGPLSSSEQNQIMLFVLAMLPAICLAAGIIPAIFLIFGILMMKKNGDFSHVEAAVKNFRGYCYFAILVATAFALFFAIKIGGSSSWESKIGDFLSSLAFIGIAIIYLSLVDKLFFSPLAAHAQWIEVNGIFSNKTRSALRQGMPAGMDTIHSEKETFSVANELIKLMKLKEDGHIT